MQEAGQLMHVLVDVAVAVQEDVQPEGLDTIRKDGQVWTGGGNMCSGLLATTIQVIPKVWASY